MKKTFKIATNGVDNSGDMFCLEGVIINNPTPVLRDFKNNDPIGYATVTKTEEGLFAEMDIDETHTGLYPAVGGQLIKYRHRPDGVRELLEVNLHSVGLCAHPNVDSKIKPI